MNEQVPEPTEKEIASALEAALTYEKGRGCQENCAIVLAAAYRKEKSAREKAEADVDRLLNRPPSRAEKAEAERDKLRSAARLVLKFLPNHENLCSPMDICDGSCHYGDIATFKELVEKEVKAP